MIECAIQNRKPSMNKLTIRELARDKKFLKDINFLNHIGYFCHDPKKAKELKDPQTYIEKTTIQGERIEIVYRVSPNPDFGYPSVTAYQICDFIDRVLAYHGRPAINPFPFDMTTLRDFLGLSKTGPNNNRICNALNQLKFTAIQTSHFFLDRNRKWIKTSYSLIDKLVFVGENKDDVRAGLIYLNKDIIESFNNKNQIPVNYERYGDLPTPAKVLYLKLFRAFSAARKNGKSNNEISAENDYNALCRVLGFTPKQYKSDIKRQLKPHLITLKEVKQLIRGYDIKKKKDKKGFKLATEPGKGFHEDYDTFNKTQNQLELDFKKRDTKTKQEIQEIEAVGYFHEKQFGIVVEKAGHVNDKEITLARVLLNKFPKGKIFKFIDYAIEEAKQTNFKIKTFNGLKGFINEFIGKESKREKAQTAKKSLEEVQEKENETKNLYHHFLETTYKAYLKKLKPGEKKTQEKLIHKKVLDNPFCNADYKRKGEKSLAYKGQKIAEIVKFTEEALIQEHDFFEYLKEQGKEDLIEVNYR